jgi:hypothetical protein
MTRPIELLRSGVHASITRPVELLRSGAYASITKPVELLRSGASALLPRLELPPSRAFASWCFPSSPAKFQISNFKSKVLTVFSRIRSNPFSNLRFQIQSRHSAFKNSIKSFLKSQISNPKWSQCFQEFDQILSQISNFKSKVVTAFSRIRSSRSIALCPYPRSRRGCRCC